jgi:hypothetical protein
MRSAGWASRVSRVALGVALLVLAGCSTTDPSPSASSDQAAGTTAPGSGATYTIDETTEGFVYSDVPAGYAITFPQRPEVEPLLNNEASDVPSNYVSASLTSSVFVSIGQVLDKEPQLRNQLLGYVQSLNPTGQVTAGSYTLGALDAVRAEFTTGDSQAIPSHLVGQPAEVVMAGDGFTFYQLLAIGGSSDQRQAFFESFERID